MKILQIVLFSILLSLPITAIAQNKIRISSEIKRIENMDYYVHKAAAGETIKKLALAYNVSEESILAKNPRAAQGIKAKQSILIPTQRTIKLLETREIEPETTQIKPDRNSSRDKKSISSNTTIKAGKQETNLEKRTGKQIDSAKFEQFTGELREFDKTAPIKVAYILPLVNPNRRAIARYSEFFNGALLAMNELKSERINIDAKLISYNQQTDSTLSREEYLRSEAQRIIRSGELDDVSLIIGPIYPEEIKPFADWATENKVAIVSPLASCKDLESPYLFQATPCETTKYAKLEQRFKDPNSNIIVLTHSTMTDTTALAEFRNVMPENYKVLENVNTVGLSSIYQMLSRDKENILIIPIAESAPVGSIIEKINALNLNLRYKIRVVGLSGWGRFTNITNYDTFFKLNVTYIPNYHEDRMNSTINGFYSKYISSFEAIPSMFSMRGYDLTTTFISALSKFGTKMPELISDFDTTPLQVKYHYERDPETRKIVNKEWMMVTFSSDFTIKVE